MKSAKQKKMPVRAAAPRPRQRGAALILTVVVIMILTTLGMAMVAFTTTEERSASAYRDAMQARAIAESGVRIVQMMFADPSERELVPVYAAGGGADYQGTTPAAIDTSLALIGIYRADRSPITPAKYTGYGDRFFAGPFGGAGGWASAFGGTYVSGGTSLWDLRFNCTNPATNVAVASTDCWLDKQINSKLIASTDFNLNTGRITDISFYGPPAELIGGSSGTATQYGICTVRVTAEKVDSNGQVVARETVEAIIGDNNPKPAVLGNGNINFITSGGEMCGNGCEQIHANGNATVGDASGGQDPMITATGTITAGSGTSQPGASFVTPPEVNPWDLSFKPTSATELAKYYLVAARPLDAVWTDGNAATPASKAPLPCGLPGAGSGPLLSQCQDYNLEYAADGTVKPARTNAMVPKMYIWNATANEWTECSSGTTLNCGSGSPTFSVTPAADLVAAGTGDTNDVPYNKLRVPRTNFLITGKQDGATVLVDGMFQKSNPGMNGIMTIIAVGSIRFSTDTEWFPAMANRTMWVTGRDIDVQSNCCLPSNTCSVNLANNAAQSIVAAHEQIFSQSQTALAGIVIGESRVDFDTITTGGTAIDIQRGDHAYTCGLPDWPWELPTKPVIFSLKSSTN
jgi:hypothetical protein